MFVRAIKLLPSQHKIIKYQFIRFPRYFCISVYIEAKTLKYLTSFWLWDFYEHAQHISDTSAFCNIIIPQTKKFKIYTILNLLNMLDELINKEYYCRLVYAWLSSPARYSFFFFFLPDNFSRWLVGKWDQTYRIWNRYSIKKKGLKKCVLFCAFVKWKPKLFLLIIAIGN